MSKGKPSRAAILKDVQKRAAEIGNPIDYQPDQKLIRAPKNPDQWNEYLETLETGEHRAGICKTLGGTAWSFYNAIPESHMERLAKELLRVVDSKKNFARTKIRAIQAAISIFKNLPTQMAILQREGATSEINHCLKLLAAFNNAMGHEGFTKLAQTLVSLTSKNNNTPGQYTDSDVITVSKATLNMLTDGMKAYAEYQALLEPYNSKANKNDPKIIEAANRLKMIEMEVSDAEPRVAEAVKD